MPFEEKVTWVSAVVSVLVSAVYFSVVAGQLGSGPVSEIAYQRWMLIAVGATIAMTIVGSIMAGIGTGISAEITGKGSVDDIGLKDERDEHINRRGERAAFYVASVGALGALALAMLRSDQFWIANALYLTFVVAGLVSSAVKLIDYRRGF